MISFRSWLAQAAFACLVPLLVLSASIASAQGFSARPMLVEASVPGGRTVTIPFRLSNSSGLERQIMDLRIVDLIQTSAGNWRFVTPEDGLDLSGFRSSVDWMTLEQSEIGVSPGQSEEVELAIQMPRSASGTYLAGLLVSSRILGEEGAAVRVQFQFLIPIILTAAGRPAPEDIRPAGLSMVHREDGDASTAVATSRITNSGLTYSRVQGRIRVERRAGETWRLVTVADLPKRGIVPGMTLALEADLERRLPSGDYRLTGELLIDGRRTPPTQEIVAFAGDPEVDEVAYDTALRIEPLRIEMDAVAGATRSQTLMLENPGDQPVEVTLAVETPESLQGVAMGDLVGTELSAEGWTQVQPTSVTLRPGARRNVRVLARIPREPLDHATYFSDIVLQARYENGQSAGTARTTVALSNPEVAPAPSGKIDQLSLSRAPEADRYFVQSLFVNTGNVSLDPKVTVRVQNAAGTEAARAELAGDNTALLPLGTRTFGGELDLSQLPPGGYALVAEAPIPGGRGTVVKQIRIDVAASKDPDAPLNVDVVTQ